MAVMSPAPSSAVPGLSRRSFLAASSAAGLALLAACTSSSSSTPPRDRVTDRQADALAAQVRVQEGVVAAYAAVTAGDPALGAQVAELAGQAGTQLARLRAASPATAAPGSASGSTGAAGTTAAAPPPGTDPQVWLREQVTSAADSHATACLGQSGARAALLGSVAAGLRGQAGRLT
jgi:hypothetical protein